ncbi:hypothetical protein VUR80DRAFT_668 [Thermomyces stellatus]
MVDNNPVLHSIKLGSSCLGRALLEIGGGGRVSAGQAFKCHNGGAKLLHVLLKPIKGGGIGLIPLPCFTARLAPRRLELTLVPSLPFSLPPVSVRQSQVREDLSNSFLTAKNCYPWSLPAEQHSSCRGFPAKHILPVHSASRLPPARTSSVESLSISNPFPKVLRK